MISGSCEALVIIFRDWEQPHSSGDLGNPAESKNELKKSHLKGKAYISFDFLKNLEFRKCFSNFMISITLFNN